MPVTLMICCNDYRNGNCLEKADSFELFDCRIAGGNPIRVRFRSEKLPRSNSVQGDHTLIFGREKFPCLAWSTWVGNWCWDAATIRGIYAVTIWNMLSARGDYCCEEAPSELFRLFHQRGQIDPRTAPEFLGRILHPERRSA